jgi:protein ImuB
MLWIGLHLPLLPLEAFAATLGAAQHALPLALLEDAQITAVNRVAAAAGIKPGIKRATALALAPQLQLGQADARRDAQARLAVAHAALAFTPSVCLHGERGVLLEVASTQRAFGGLQKLIGRLQADTAPLALTLRLATAPTALGAAMLASWAQRPAVVGAHTTELAALRQLLDGAPVWLLGPGRAHWEALQGMGLRTLADLRTLPRAGLARRFGETLLTDLDRARGDAPEVHEWLTLPEIFESRLELFARADTTVQVLHGAATLLQRLVAWARARQARVARFTLAMQHEPRHRADDRTPPSTTLEVALAEAAADAVHLQALLRERLARLPLPAPTLELRLHCRDLVHRGSPNGELFPTRASAQEGLVRLVERLQARLGPAQVARLQRVADHRPERATVLHALEPGAAPPREPPGGLAQLATGYLPEHLTRPVWLLPEPQPLQSRRMHPLLYGQPLLMLAGPERIEAGWWDGALIARDYFVAQAHDGSLVWVYRARLPPAQDEAGWFMQGLFA